MTSKEISETLDDIVKYFGRCYMNAANGSKAQELYKRYMAAASAASYKIGKKKEAKRWLDVNTAEMR